MLIEERIVVLLGGRELVYTGRPGELVDGGEVVCGGDIVVRVLKS